MSVCKKEKEGAGPSKRKFHSIGVFGAANLGKDIDFIEVANNLGKALAARGINLVYEGGIYGLRGCTAAAATAGGSKVFGIILNDLVNKSTNYPFGTEIKVSSLPERLGYMFYSAEAFIALPGGLETMEGIFNIAYWANLNFHKKPLGLLNVNGFYDGLLSFLDHAVEQNFISQATRGTIISASNADQLIDQLQILAFEPDSLMKHVDRQSTDSKEKHVPDTTLRL